jgi:hypothetical protein
VALLLASSIFSPGCLLFCIAILRSGTAAHWVGLLLPTRIPLAFWPPLQQLVGIIGGVQLGLGYIRFGYTLWAKTSQQGIQAQVMA